MRPTVLRDLLASVVVFLVALPLCMGIAIASGVPPAMGLMTGIIGGIVVGALSGSRLQVSGPAAGLTVLVWQIVDENGLGMLGPILLLAGLLQLIAGIARLGQWFRAISPSVVSGMLAGIGVLIFASQFHVMVDDTPKSSGIANLLSIPSAIYKGLVPMDGSTHELAAAIGIVTMVTLLLWNRFRPESMKLLPGPLVAVVVGTVAATVWGLPIQYVDVPASLVSAIRWPEFQNLLRLGEPRIAVEAVALAFIASAETLLSAVAVDRMRPGSRTNYDRELAAQGVGNLMCGAVGALPMTGVIVRSAANVTAGAETRLSTILHGVWLLVLVATLPQVLATVPTASLAAVLVYTGAKLVNFDTIRQLATYGRMPVVIYGATLGGIVLFDLLTGVVIGILLTIAQVLYRITHLEMHLLPHPAGNRMELHLEGIATVLRLPHLADTLDRVPDGTELHLHVDRLLYIDHSCLDLLAGWEEQRRAAGCRLVVEREHLFSRYRPAWRKGEARVPARAHEKAS